MIFPLRDELVSVLLRRNRLPRVICAYEVTLVWRELYNYFSWCGYYITKEVIKSRALGNLPSSRSFRGLYQIMFTIKTHILATT